MPDLPNAPPALTHEDITRLKPSAGCFFLAIPVVAILAVFLAYVWLFYNGWIGRPASGDGVEYTFRACSEAQDVVRSRVEDMGLADLEIRPTDDGFLLSMTLPSAETRPEDLARVLASPGTFEIRAGDRVLADIDGVASAGVRLDLTMSPSTLVVLTDSARDTVYGHMNGHPEGSMDLWLDGEKVWTMSNLKPTQNGEIEVPPDAENDRARMELAAGRGIALNNGPLPCPVEVAGTTVVQVVD